MSNPLSSIIYTPSAPFSLIYVYVDVDSTCYTVSNNYLDVSPSSTSPIEVRAEDIMLLKNCIVHLICSMLPKLLELGEPSNILQGLQQLDLKSGDIVLARHRTIISYALDELLNVFAFLPKLNFGEDEASGSDSGSS